MKTENKKQDQRKQKSGTVCLAVLAMAIGSIAGCGQSGDSTPERTVETVYKLLDAGEISKAADLMSKGSSNVLAGVPNTAMASTIAGFMSKCGGLASVTVKRSAQGPENLYVGEATLKSNDAAKCPKDVGNWLVVKEDGKLVVQPLTTQAASALTKHAATSPAR